MKIFTQKKPGAIQFLLILLFTAGELSCAMIDAPYLAVDESDI